MAKTIKQELEGLDSAFKKVAAAIKQDLPEVWDKAMGLYDNDEDKAVRFLASPSLMHGGQRLCDVASESEEGKTSIIEHIARIEHGIVS